MTGMVLFFAPMAWLYSWGWWDYIKNWKSISGAHRLLWPTITVIFVALCLTDLVFPFKPHA